MSQAASDRNEEALAWLVRANDPEFDGWDEFTLWLERDPANAVAYHDLAQAESEMLPVVRETATPEPMTRRQPAPPSRPSWRIRYAAASGVLVFALGTALFLSRQDLSTRYETGAGEQREVALAGSGRLLLNGDTRVVLSGPDKHQVNLESGQILLEVERHRGQAVTVLTGGLTLTDVGTVFDVTREGSATRVEVSRGLVLASSATGRVRLPAGTRLDAVDGDKLLAPSGIGQTAVGGWRSGQLDYDNEPLPSVVADLRRATGLQLRSAGQLSGRRFTGTLSVGNVKRDPQSLEPLLGVAMSNRDGGWTVQAR